MVCSILLSQKLLNLCGRFAFPPGWIGIWFVFSIQIIFLSSSAHKASCCLRGKMFLQCLRNLQRFQVLAPKKKIKLRTLRTGKGGRQETVHTSSGRILCSSKRHPGIQSLKGLTKSFTKTHFFSFDTLLHCNNAEGLSTSDWGSSAKKHGGLQVS